MSAVKNLSTVWILIGQYGQTMSLDQLRDTYYPTVSRKTMQNKACKGELPPSTGGVYDVRDVAAWWDSKRQINA